jgi:hypothetical protein
MRASPSASSLHGVTARQHKVDHFVPNENGDKEGAALTVDYGGTMTTAAAGGALGEPSRLEQCEECAATKTKDEEMLAG